jgi:hypothetical protein
MQIIDKAEQKLGDSLATSALLAQQQQPTGGKLGRTPIDNP